VTKVRRSLKEVCKDLSDGWIRAANQFKDRRLCAKQIEHVEIRKNGNPRRARKNNFNYVAQINQVSGSPSVEEYRISAKPIETAAGEMVDTGTAALR
jgi:hypothetical protein